MQSSVDEILNLVDRTIVDVIREVLDLLTRQFNIGQLHGKVLEQCEQGATLCITNLKEIPLHDLYIWLRPYTRTTLKFIWSISTGKLHDSLELRLMFGSYAQFSRVPTFNRTLMLNEELVESLSGHVDRDVCHLIVALCVSLEDPPTTRLKGEITWQNTTKDAEVIMTEFKIANLDFIPFWFPVRVDRALKKKTTYEVFVRYDASKEINVVFRWPSKLSIGKSRAPQTITRKRRRSSVDDESRSDVPDITASHKRPFLGWIKDVLMKPMSNFSW